MTEIAQQLGRTPHAVWAFLRYKHIIPTTQQKRAKDCPTCGAFPGKPCKGSNGYMKTHVHRARFER